MFLGFLSFPIILLNLLGGVVSFVWLAIAGEWSLIIYGIIASVAVYYVFLIVSSPAMGLQFLSMKIYERDNKLLKFISYPLALVADIYLTILTIIWVYLVFYYSYTLIDTFDIQSVETPVLIWAYSISIGFLNYLARHDSLETYSASFVTSFSASIGAIYIVISMLFFDYSLPQTLFVFIIIMLVSLIINFYHRIKFQKLLSNVDKDNIELG